MLAFFKEQVSTNAMMLDLFALIAITAVFMATAGLALMDVGAARTRNVIDTVMQKFVAGGACAAGFMIAGYGIWNWQFNSAFGVKNPLGQGISDWWIGGQFVTKAPQDIDPTVLPNADQYLIFYGLFIVFAFFLGAAMQSAVLERMKVLPLTIISFITGAVLFPAFLYLLWGSASPLTLLGVHDDVGGFAVYLPLAAIGVTLAWQLGPRKGKFGLAAGSDAPGPRNVALIGVGLLFVLTNLVMFAIAGGYQLPGAGYFGIAYTKSGMGLVTFNLICAMLGGGIGGALLSYRTKNPLWLIGGPFMGYVSVTTFNDVGKGWFELLVGFTAVYVGYATAHLLHRLRIDEDKLGPLVLGPGIFGAIAGGFLTWGTRTGGILGIESGKYRFHLATITPWWQLLGVVICVVGSVTVTYLICQVLKRTTGLRVTDEEEAAGMDATYWSEVLIHDVPSDPPPSGSSEADRADGEPATV
ncbi:MAG TPA: hypothetical protein VGG40_06745 [Solirubrobacterales bacterium]|jgi:ammonia channel protein AmtB